MKAATTVTNGTAAVNSDKFHRQMSGKVVSDKMQKTVTVLINRRVKHPLYGKYVTLSTKIHAHNDMVDVVEGDMVTIEETRPISKTKAWKVIRIDRKGESKEVIAG